jgi:hypothetical protein
MTKTRIYHEHSEYCGLSNLAEEVGLNKFSTLTIGGTPFVCGKSCSA